MPPMRRDHTDTSLCQRLKSAVMNQGDVSVVYFRVRPVLQFDLRQTDSCMKVCATCSIKHSRLSGLHMILCSSLTVKKKYFFRCLVNAVKTK